jgi:hypothetical protein
MSDTVINGDVVSEYPYSDSSLSMPATVAFTHPEPDRFAAEVFRGMQQIASGLGMIIAAWGRKYALKR